MNLPGDRLSRTDRQRLRTGAKTRAAMALAIILILLIAGRVYWNRLMQVIPDDIFGSRSYAEIQALADSAIIQACSDFRLSDTLRVDTLIQQQDGNFLRVFGLSWPRNLPFEFLAKSIAELCRESRLSCDCRESAADDYMTCDISSGEIVRARLIVREDRKAKLNGRGLALVFKNLGSLGYEKIREILKGGVIFGYIGSPNEYPSGRIKRALRSAGVATILEIPGKKSDLIEFKNKNESHTTDKFDIGLMSDIFRRHPNVGAVYVSKSDEYELGIVKAAISTAKKNNIPYLYQNSRPDEIDSLAYSSGLDIMAMKNVADFSDGFNNEEVTLLVHDLAVPDNPDTLIAIVNGENCDEKSLVRLRDTLNGLGIKLFGFNQLTDAVDSF
jgi:hypothetical protein